MSVTLDISEDTQRALEQAFGQGLSRAALEALAIEGYRLGKLSTYQIQTLLGFEDRWETQDWLGKRGICLNYTLEDLESDRLTLDRVLGTGKH